MGEQRSPLEGLVMNREFWRGRPVLVTGHTGFKGSWLCLWLADLGAEVHGFSLAPPSSPSLFEAANVENQLASHTHGDIRDLEALQRCMEEHRPHVVFHLAAQSLVRPSYQDPLGTLATNVMGTANLLQATRSLDELEAVISVTSDKCYENREWVWPYRENDPMGGHDPYSASKGCAELVTAAFRQSFWQEDNAPIASARAGNVIGGGDWGEDRLVPDFFRAIQAGEPITLRSPQAIRPWQHVLEPLSGYMLLAEKLSSEKGIFAQAWNFGPNEQDCRPVEWLISALCQTIPESTYQVDASPQVHEANLLKLDSSKAIAQLGWRPRWRLATTVEKTASWYRAWQEGQDMQQFSLEQIHSYQSSGSAA